MVAAGVYLDNIELVLEQGKTTKRGEKGNVVRMVGTYINITPAKKAEHEKNELREQLNPSKKMETLGLLAGELLTISIM